jgi:hypothetical protein
MKTSFPSPVIPRSNLPWVCNGAHCLYSPQYYYTSGHTRTGAFAQPCECSPHMMQLPNNNVGP